MSDQLVKTNIDRRFVLALREYIDILSERKFSPIKAELYSNRIRSYLTEMRDEVPAFAVAEITAPLLSQEQVLRQFPAWRTFEEDASRFQLTPDQLSQQKSVLEGITEETREATGIASPDVVQAFVRLNDEGHLTTRKPTTELGVWRSIENFVKTNLKHIIDKARAFQTSASENQTRYIRYLERLLPHIKLYVRMNDSLQWLMPVIQWLEDIIKTAKTG